MYTVQLLHSQFFVQKNSGKTFKDGRWIHLDGSIYHPWKTLRPQSRRLPKGTGTSMTLYGRILISKKQSISALVKKRCARLRAQPENQRSRSPFWKNFRSRSHSWLKSAAHFFAHLKSNKAEFSEKFSVKFHFTCQY